MQYLKSLERRKKILELVNNYSEIKIKEISKILNEKEDKIRRDVRILNEMGVLKTFYGGIKKLDEISLIEKFYYKKIENYQEKKLISEKALKLINEGESIFLGAGTTVFKLAGLLYYLDIKLDIVTISLPVATLLSNKNNYNLILIGGQLVKENQSFEGQLVPENLKHYIINKSFMGMRGFSIEHGFTIPTIEQVTTYRAVAKSTDELIVLVDSTKFLKHCLIKVATFEDKLFKDKIRKVITDKNIDRKYVNKLNEENIEVLIV